LLSLPVCCVFTLMVAGDPLNEPLTGAPQDGPVPQKCGGKCCNPLIKHLDQFQEPHKRPKQVCAVVCFFAFWWFLFRGILQFLCFHYATMGCSASALQGYNYPGASWTCPSGVTEPREMNQWQHALDQGCVHTPKDNAVPGIALLLERAEDQWTGAQSFEVYHATEGNAQIDRAPVGAWWRTWGPWFWTYSYEDIQHSKTTLYMRPTLMGMMGLYSETRIMRCDGDGDVWFFGEGSNWISNRIRSFFHMQRESSFKVYKGSSKFATALETFHGTKSISFKANNDDPLGSTVLVENSGHKHDLWSIHLADSVDIHALPPYYVMNAASVLMGFRWITIGGPGRHPSQQPQFLAAETLNSSVAFFEEAGEVDDDQQPESLDGGDENTAANNAADEKTDA